MKFIHTDDEMKGKFQALEDEKEAGLLTYTREGKSKILIQHTLVHPEFKGRNVGTGLVMEMVNFARSEKLKVIPVCPFVRNVFNKNEDLGDVL